MIVAENYPERMHNGNHSAQLGITTRRPVHNQTMDCLPGSRQGDATLVPNRLWAHGFQTASGEPGPKQAFLKIYPSGLSESFFLLLGTSIKSVIMNPFENGLNKVRTTVALLLRPSCQWAKTPKL